jgi:hypothetical protein
MSTLWSWEDSHITSFTSVSELLKTANVQPTWVCRNDLLLPGYKLRQSMVEVHCHPLIAVAAGGSTAVLELLIRNGVPH